MEAFKKMTSTIVPLDMNDIDTDMIIPAQYLTKVDKLGYGEHAFQRLKEQNKDFTLNNPLYKNSEVIITKNNFGCGSSREHAVWALQQSGIKAIIAESYSDIFSNNSAKNGLLLIKLSSENISKIINESKKNIIEINIDLKTQTIDFPKNKYLDSIKFLYDKFRKDCLLKGIDDLDYLLEATKK